MLLPLPLPGIWGSVVAVAIVVRGGLSPGVAVFRVSSCKTRTEGTGRGQTAVPPTTSGWCCGVSPVFHVVMVIESEVLEHEPEVTELDVKLG